MRTTTFKGASMSKSELNAYSVGIMRLNEVHIASGNFEHEDIEFIGQCSISRREVVIGKIGNFWCIHGRNLDTELKVQRQYGRAVQFKAYYIMRGKRITILHPCTGESMANFECRNTSKPFDKMSADEIFNAAKGKSSPKHGGKANAHTDIGKYKNRPSISLTAYGY